MTEQRPDPERRAWRTDAEWRRLSQRIAAAEAVAREPAWKRYRVSAVAAAAVLVAGVYGARTLRDGSRSPSPASFTVVQSAAGQPRTVTLNDGTRVDLAPASTLRYRINATARDVVLDGAARFTVVHDANRPFEVRAGRARVTDLGTTFQVAAYRRDSSVAVSVTEGVVALSDSGGSTPLELPAGSAGRVALNGRVERAVAPAASDTAWVSGTLQFTNAELRDVVRTLSRWFDVNVQITDRSLGQRRITALYTQPTLDDVLEALAAASQARVVRTNGTITLVAR